MDAGRLCANAREPTTVHECRPSRLKIASPRPRRRRLPAVASRSSRSARMISAELTGSLTSFRLRTRSTHSSIVGVVALSVNSAREVLLKRHARVPRSLLHRPVHVRRDVANLNVRHVSSLACTLHALLDEARTGYAGRGGVPERSNGTVLKTVDGATRSWVRIPPPPSRRGARRDRPASDEFPVGRRSMSEITDTRNEGDQHDRNADDRRPRDLAGADRRAPGAREGAHPRGRRDRRGPPAVADGRGRPATPLIGAAGEVR